jgi:DNA-binding NarL/FixJ family response regulator
MNTISVLAIDDSETFLHGIESLLALEPDLQLVGKARCGQEAVAKACALKPAITLADLRLCWQAERERPTQEAGLRMIREVVNACPPVKVIVISSYSERCWVVQAVNAGAQGYLPKEASVETILNAIRIAAQGGIVLTQEQLTWLRSPEETLTPREREVLVLLAAGKSDAQIALQLSIAMSTASKHVENIRNKMDVSSRGEAVAAARDRGLL